MDAMKLRCQGDRELSEQLVADPLISRLIDKIDEEAEQSPSGIRRRLLATALRLTPEMSPAIGSIIEHCRTRLGVELPMETYVYSSPEFNAACVKPEGGRLFIMLSSSLLEAFPPGELRFVIGHELGHHLFGHHEIPIAYVLRGTERPSPQLALRLFSWSRYAEISADRAGAACADDFDAVASALFRLASGLRGDLVNVHIDEFAAQVDEMRVEADDPAQRSDESEWFTTHPFSPLRVKALKFFADSELARDGGDGIDALEAKVQTLMALMEPSYLDEKSEVAETMRRLLFAAAIAVAEADGEITEDEIAVFEKLFGKEAFSDKLDVDAIKGVLETRITEAMEIVPRTRRIQVLRDLCLILHANGHVHTQEVDVMKSIATGLGISNALVEQTIACRLDPD